MNGLVMYGAVLALLLAAAPDDFWDPTTAQYFLAIGLIGTWRYSWAAVHWVRAMIYQHIVFPRWRAAADRLIPEIADEQVYMLLTSFRIDTETTRRVYQAAFEEAIACGLPVTLVASIVEMGDQRLIKRLFEALNPPDHVRLVLVRIMGSGKRDALACGFRAISIDRPPPGSVVLVIDGDSLLEPGTIKKTLPFFKLFPNASALTTDEFCEVVGRRIFREWYNLRFAQRHVLMSSVGLSRHVLTLTGRMSAFRSEVVTDPEFISRVEMDYIDHPRLGRFKFLTGDDKSSWYEILQSGKEMLYIPDVLVRTIETPPDDDFMASATMLMRRWFGNMLRTNERAIMLGPRRMGLFTWWCILDQRVSMWTSLVGPVAVTLVALLKAPIALPLYAIWIIATRYLQALMLYAVRRDVTAWWPPLLYFNQIYGSMIKVFVLFHLDKQKWTRQNTVGKRDLTAWRERINKWSSRYAMVTFVMLFIMLIANLVNALPVVDGKLAGSVLHLLTAGAV